MSIWWCEQRLQEDGPPDEGRLKWHPRPNDTGCPGTTCPATRLSNDIGRGIEIYQELVRKIMASKPRPESNLADAFNLSNIYAAMSALHHRTSRPEQAAELDARCLELWRHWDRKLPDNSFVRRQLEAKRLP